MFWENSVNIRTIDYQINFLPKRMLISRRKLLFVVSVIILSVIVVYLFQLASRTIAMGDRLEGELVQTIQRLEIQNKASINMEQMKKTYQGYETITGKKGIVYTDIDTIFQSAQNNNVLIKKIEFTESTEGVNIKVICSVDYYTTYTDLIAQLNSFTNTLLQTKRFSAVSRDIINWPPAIDYITFELKR